MGIFISLTNSNVSIYLTLKVESRLKMSLVSFEMSSEFVHSMWLVPPLAKQLHREKRLQKSSIFYEENCIKHEFEWQGQTIRQTYDFIRHVKTIIMFQINEKYRTHGLASVLVRDRINLSTTSSRYSWSPDT